MQVWFLFPRTHGAWQGSGCTWWAGSSQGCRWWDALSPQPLHAGPQLTPARNGIPCQREVTGMQGDREELNVRLLPDFFCTSGFAAHKPWMQLWLEQGGTRFCCSAGFLRSFPFHREMEPRPFGVWSRGGAHRHLPQVANTLLVCISIRGTTREYHFLPLNFGK